MVDSVRPSCLSHCLVASSNASVCGALLGCKFGYSGLPKDLLEGLVYHDWLDKLVDKFLTMMGLAGQPSSSAGDQSQEALKSEDTELSSTAASTTTDTNTSTASGLESEKTADSVANPSSTAEDPPDHVVSAGRAQDWKKKYYSLDVPIHPLSTILCPRIGCVSAEKYVASSSQHHAIYNILGMNSPSTLTQCYMLASTARACVCDFDGEWRGEGYLLCSS